MPSEYGYLSHAERRDRRRQIAEEVSNGTPPSVVARRHGVTASTVTKACQEHNVRPEPTESRTAPERSLRTRLETFRILRAVLDARRLTDVAREFRVSRQYVAQVRERAVAAGFDVPALEQHEQRAAHAGAHHELPELG